MPAARPSASCRRTRGSSSPTSRGWGRWGGQAGLADLLLLLAGLWSTLAHKARLALTGWLILAADGDGACRLSVSQGASGTVYAAKDKRTGERRALKIAPVSELADLTNEIGLQSLSDHEGIVRIYEAYVTSSEVRLGGLLLLAAQA